MSAYDTAVATYYDTSAKNIIVTMIVMQHFICGEETNIKFITMEMVEVLVKVKELSMMGITLLFQMHGEKDIV